MLYYYTKRKNNYVIYQNELYILWGVNWHWRGLVLLIKDRNNTDNQVQTNFSQIKPYYTSHELLIKKGYQYIKCANRVTYVKRGHVITIDLETKEIHSNLSLNLKINRILYNYQKQINDNVLDFDILNMDNKTIENFT
ncbi:MAG TPA: hypothetical protein PLP51_00765 [Acholeplasmataceae bacterium]|jgi:hypothetical protein|nr:hypothetical protein [Acholeplasmataceae bacterium]